MSASIANSCVVSELLPLICFVFELINIDYKDLSFFLGAGVISRLYSRYSAEGM
jgi:hypothetical protein